MPASPRPAARTAPRAAYHHLGQTLRSLEADLRWGLEGSARIPDAWTAIAQEQGPPPKVKLTLRVDEDVVRFFRAAGGGHLVRMNAVLRAFMQARLAGVVKGPEAVAYAPTPAERFAAGGEALLAMLSTRGRMVTEGRDTTALDRQIMAALEALEGAAEGL